MKYPIDEMIDRYFDGQLSATEQTDLLSQVSGDPVAQQLFEAEQFIRGAFTHDASAVPQAAMEPSASLLAKLSATKPLGGAATKVASEATRETATQAVSQSATTAAVKSTSVASGVSTKVGVGGLGVASKTIMGLSVGAFKAVLGTVAAVAVTTAVVVSSNNTTPDAQQIATPVTDSSANSFVIENKIDTPITTSSTPVAPVDAKDSRIKSDVDKTVVSDKAAPYAPGDPMKELENQKPRFNSSDTAKARFDTRNADH
ncbi:MAG TPA: hypothetical protein VFH43_02275 [Candidatus Kapabacteria bacterium]|nr:hypothetical protein [Candidatus Kapabacteria bacterium]